MKKKYIIIIIVLAIIRLLLGVSAGVWFASNQSLDDNLLANYSILPMHFLSPNVFSLVKTMSYPLFINLCFLIGFRYSELLSIIWIIDALYVGYIVNKITRKKVLSIFSYVYVLFLPMAFELWLGTRLYRNSIIAPFVLLFICLIIRKIYSLNGKINYKNELIKQFFLGLILSFTYYIKEDGIWLLCCYLFSMVIELFYLICRIKKEKASKKTITKTVTIFLIPIFVFIAYTNVYKAINYSFFGIYEIETKSSGQLGKFVSNIYKIESKDRTSIYWAPKDAIEKAYSVSATFKKYSELKDDIIHTQWSGGNIETIPIKGDFLTWVLRTSLENTKIWKSEKQVDNLFKQINMELDNAFKEGKLKKDRRIQLISSAGGRTPKEILKLGKIVLKSYRDTLLLNGYNAGLLYGQDDNEFTTYYYSVVLKENYIVKENRNINQAKITNAVIVVIFIIYRCLNVFLFSVLIINLVVNFYKSLKKIIKKQLDSNTIKYFIILCLFLISVIYTFSISWFTEFIHYDNYDSTIQNFYVIALPVLLVFPFLLSIDIGVDKLKEYFSRHKLPKMLVQILKFIVVGGIATVIDWAIYYIFYNIVKIDPLIANIIAFSVSVTYNYIASVKWVFEVNQDKSKKQMFMEFMIFSIIGLLLTEGIIYIGTDKLKMDAMLIKIIATAIVMVFNFITRKIFLEKSK